jgi:hypothetical protein
MKPVREFPFGLALAMCLAPAARAATLTASDEAHFDRANAHA